MVLTRTFKASKKSGYLLPELLVTTAVATLAFSGVAVLLYFSSHAMARLQTAYELERQARVALRYLATDVRSARTAVLVSTNQLLLRGRDTNTYIYSPVNGSLTRLSLNGRTNLLLRGCTSLKFELMNKTQPTAGFAQLSSSTLNPKLISVEWSATRGGRLKEPPRHDRSAKFVLRNQ
jgi:type II secretory pathway pseudopilin PulG